MAAKKPKGGQAQDMDLPDDFVPRQAVENPIINSAYTEPTSHWFYAKGSSTAEKVPGRRPAQYWFKTKRVTEVQEGELFAEEESDLLPLVNALRKDVKRWRESGYRCNNNVTKTLLNHWRRPDAARPIFFCQLEAVETIIYILEFGLPGHLARTGFRNFDVSDENFARLFSGRELDQAGLSASDPLGGKFNKDLYPRLVDPSGRSGEIPLRRLGCKMATGSGKTTVMAMLITWAFCNRGEKPESREFPNAVLVCAPNLTVKKRLQVLCPENEENYYKQFELVPAQYAGHMSKGKVLVTNWHSLAERSIHGEGGHKVVDLGKESHEAFAQNRLGELARLGQILVLNDEGHHCWRPKALSEEERRELFRDLTPEEIKGREEEQEEARVWLEGLDKINNAGLAGKGADGAALPSILACVDLSATPFYLGNSGFPEGSPFHWLVSDFGLVDAIECGITKVPRLPIKDDTGAVDEAGRPDPKYFRLWSHIKAQAKRTDYNGKRLKPEFIYIQAEDALQTIASQWKKSFDDIEANHPGATPPVLIIVCDTTDTAQLFFENISGQTTEDVVDPETGKVEKVVRFGSGKLFPEHLSNTDKREVTIRIDSRKLDEIDPDAGDTKDEAALKLREIIHTVGKKGKPGEHIRCVVSVSMLTEGWDANTVTHILGIRAFGTQLLCEQVVGRGLRRRSYEPDPATGLLPAEYVDVYGIPFSLIPYKGQAKTTEKTTDSVYTYIHAVEERKHFEIKFPNVESYTYELRDSQILCDVDKMEIYDATAQPVAHEVWVQAAKGIKETLAAGDQDGYELHDLKEYYATLRPQEVIFSLASRVMQTLLSGDSGSSGIKITEAMVNRARLMPELVGIVQQYVHRRVKYPQLSGATPDDCRLLALEIHAREVVSRIHDGILPKAAKDGEGRLLPVLSRFLKYHSTEGASFNTTLRTIPLSKSHLNRAPVNGYEEAAINELEETDAVLCYTPNHKSLGFSIAYTTNGEVHAYYPDLIVKLRNGTTIVIEIKGVGGRLYNPDAVNAKNAAAIKWCQAVSNVGNLGNWFYRICDGGSPGEMLTELRKVLAEVGAGSVEQVPYKIIEPQSARPWVDCVPLRSLRSIAGQGRATQQRRTTDLVEGYMDYPLVTWNGHPAFADGMFVARIPFANLGSEIPFRCHGLLRLIDAEDCTPWLDKLVLVRTRGSIDKLTGDEWTLRWLRFVRGPDEHNLSYRYDLEDAEGRAIEITTDKEGRVPVLAEFIGLLPPVA